MERFGSFGLIKKEPKEPKGEGRRRWEMAGKWKGNVRERESEGKSKSKERGMRREM